MAEKFSINSKMICPYCKAKQEYIAHLYFKPGSHISFNLQCDSCDEFFNASKTRSAVYSFSNLISSVEGEISP